MRRRATVLSVALVLAIGCSVVADADWAQWQGPLRDNKSPDTGLLKKWPAGGPKLLWTGRGLGGGYSTVAIADGMIYTTGMVSGQDTIRAFDMDGKDKWRVKNGPGWKGDKPGSRATPTIDDGLLYVLSGMGRLGCFDAKSGKEKWAVQVTSKFGGRVPKWGYAESVLIDGEKVICTPGGPRAAVVALNKKTGTTIWATTGSSDGASYCPPIVFELGGIRQIATMTVNGAMGVAPETGKVLWRYRHKTDWDVHATSLVFHNGSIYGTSGYGSGGFKLDLKVAGGKVQVTKKWTDKNLDDHHGGIVMLDGYIYGPDSRRSWVCLDFNTGALKYKTRGVGKGSITYADGMLYCFSERGTMGLVKATPTGHQVVSSFKVPRGGRGLYWAHPVVIDGRLYVRHAENLYAYDVKAR